jgi:hypothetical protein
MTAQTAAVVRKFFSFSFFQQILLRTQDPLSTRRCLNGQKFKTPLVVLIRRSHTKDACSKEDARGEHRPIPKANGGRDAAEGL